MRVQLCRSELFSTGSSPKLARPGIVEHVHLNLSQFPMHIQCCTMPTQDHAETYCLYLEHHRKRASRDHSLVLRLVLHAVLIRFVPVFGVVLRLLLLW